MAKKQKYTCTMIHGKIIEFDWLKIILLSPYFFFFFQNLYKIYQHPCKQIASGVSFLGHLVSLACTCMVYGIIVNGGIV